ncbi:hypothetical protein [Nostoc parmelioides]|uniref:Uncharacterized protein n=1 Tax=Nostoc parmelioides FACHB-3921 TaxID=2692909 RepID=A0ABR8BNP3_9NOSO|nr:hypothetical protein [Nostoc parmelioides]MBD2255591.1 hypothetical protein [Nostoc parmelioides FACHB-3921]
MSAYLYLLYKVVGLWYFVRLPVFTVQSCWSVVLCPLTCIYCTKLLVCATLSAYLYLLYKVVGLCYFVRLPVFTVQSWLLSNHIPTKIPQAIALNRRLSPIPYSPFPND